MPNAGAREVPHRLMGEDWTMVGESSGSKPGAMLQQLEEFQSAFEKYAEGILDKDLRLERDELAELRERLQQAEPSITAVIVAVIGDKTLSVGFMGTTSRRDLLAIALMGGNNAMAEIFTPARATVVSVLNQAIGALKTGLWPPTDPAPVLVIHDDLLRGRCSDLLSAPGNYDRVLREATTILEDRIRNTVGPERLAQLLPSAADHIGERLVNALFNPTKPVLSISDDKLKRIALRNMLVGTVSYLRNTSHHEIDDQTAWSWAWSVAGLVDQLLADIAACAVMPPDPRGTADG